MKSLALILYNSQNSRQIVIFSIQLVIQKVNFHKLAEQKLGLCIFIQLTLPLTFAISEIAAFTETRQLPLDRGWQELIYIDKLSMNTAKCTKWIRHVTYSSHFNSCLIHPSSTGDKNFPLMTSTKYIMHVPSCLPLHISVLQTLSKLLFAERLLC